VNKGDLVEKVAKDVAITKTQADAAVNCLIGAVTAELKKGGRVTLVGFGTFAVSARKARTGRNPQTGAPIKIAAKKVARFSPSAELKVAVNKKK
jgi:DNA-binding protein HU-beta